MRIAFFYKSCGQKDIENIHKYRSNKLGAALKKRGHDVSYTDEDIIMNQWDLLIIDHTESKKDMITRAKKYGMKVVLIDGSEHDSSLVDISISAFSNNCAEYRGSKYIIVPKNVSWDRYRSYTKSKSVFLSVGDSDSKNIADFVLGVLGEIELNAIIASCKNHKNFRDKFSRVEVFYEENYYDVMRECVISITDGGIAFFKSLHYGMPTIPIAQNELQQVNIDYLQHCCLPIKMNKGDLKTKISWLLDNEYYRKSLSMLASHFVDGEGISRVCDIIEDII